MKRGHLSSLFVMVALATGVFWTACQPKPKLTTPVGPTREQADRARADSLRTDEDAARLAREEAERRQREEAERRREAEEAQRRAAEEAARKTTLQTIYYDFDRSDLRPDQFPAMAQNVKILKEYRSTGNVFIEGHCDERGTVEYNLALGERRAAAVKRYLGDAGVTPKRISTISYGKSHPVDPGHNETAWAKNRRAELK